MFNNSSLKYGLTVRGGKSAPAPPRRPPPSVFGEESEEEEDVESQIARQAARKQTDRKVAELHAAALAEDASIFDYDSHHDAIQSARNAPAERDRAERRPRYIERLLETAEERRRDQSVLMERQMLRERQAEDHVYGTSERFVTAAYKKKLEEDRARTEEKRKM